MEIIYIDSLFFINLLTDYLLCLAAARVRGLRLHRARYFLAALFGAAYAAVIWLPGFRWLSDPVWKLGSGLVMGLIAYGDQRRPLFCTAVFFAVSAAFGGTLWAVSMAAGNGGGASWDLRTLALSFAVCYGAARLLFRCVGKLPEKPRVRIRAEFLGRAAEFTALADSGNSLTDPATGAPVLVVCPEALKPVFREHTSLFGALESVELVEVTAQIPELRGRLRLIPYTALSGPGLLPAFRPEKLTVDGRENRETLIAVSKNAAGEGFEAIL